MRRGGVGRSVDAGTEERGTGCMSHGCGGGEEGGSGTSEGGPSRGGHWKGSLLTLVEMTGGQGWGKGVQGLSLGPSPLYLSLPALLIYASLITLLLGQG